MRKILFIISCFISLHVFSNSGNELLIHNPYSEFFKKAYSLNPSIPKGILESVAFSQSRFENLGTSAQESSCIGYPTAYGVMGLTEDGKGYFRNNLLYVAQLSGYSVEDIKSNPEKNILAYAKAFSVLQNQLSVKGYNLKLYMPIFVALSELPLVNDLQNDFAMNSHLYQLYWFLSKGEFQDFYGYPDYTINLKEIFASNYEVLSSSSITINTKGISNTSGNVYRSSGIASTVASPDYPAGIWNPTTCNYSSRSGTAITAVAIHFVQGSYAGCISWFKNCSASASAHYVIRSSDGQTTQMIYESDKAWHAASANPYTLGTEHEGYINNASWFTDAMYQASADLTRDMCTSNGINPLRCYYGPGCSGTTAQCELGGCVKIKGHQMYANQTHTDPGPLWNWEKFYKLINNTPAVTTVTTTGGTFYDAGGSAGNYTNDERKLWLFQPSSGATSISMNFTAFNLENNYDYLFIYDGNSTNAPLIGKYTSTVSPGNINSTGSSLLIEFRSDCATTTSGWAATYTTNAVVTPTTSTDNISPTTLVSTVGAWKTANFTATFTDADNVGGSGLEKSYYQVIDFNGTEWRGNQAKGFFSDNFDVAIHSDWTQASGSWTITNNALEQSLETTPTASNTNIYAALTQTLSDRYLYNFKGKIEGTGNNRRAGLHFFIDNPALPNRGNSYFVYFRLDAPRVQIYKTVNDVFYLKADSANVSIIENQWYDYKVIFDRTTGKIDVYKDNTLVATWTDNVPLVAGDVAPLTNGSYISFRSGDCKWSLDEIKVYRSRPTSSVSVSVGSGNTNDIRYQNPNPTQFAAKVKSIVNDAAGNLSSIDYHDLNIDWTNPIDIATINDGKATDINVVVTSDSLSANWTSSYDPNSAIEQYWYSIGTSPGAVNTLTWTSNWGDTTVTAKNLSLTAGTTYYFNVKSENNAGLFSNVISTNGQTVSVSTGVENLTESNLVNVYPNPFNNSFTVTLGLENDSDIRMTLVDALGREITSYQTKESKGVYTKTIDAGVLNLSSGLYWIKIKYNNVELCKKLVKN
ncbi:MAG: N-acetylmuramoyl-L-alanine amidase [Bacteroidia bacterium]|nr:N-acetylmuramoyl-L-alanine amidase [Bacteroidia bacterium]